MIHNLDYNINVYFTYGEDGNRTNKYDDNRNKETLYFNQYWDVNGTNRAYSGSTQTYLDYEQMHTYYWHSDHLGSATLITDYQGKEYERIEYTPYGESWIELSKNTIENYLPYKFTGKELDEETGFYYYGQRYLDPKYSIWHTSDPAIYDYMSQSKEGEGGIYNVTNLNLYNYAGNNPVKYTDPDGRNFEYVINDEDKTITITIPITIYGDEATDELAGIYEQGINDAWGGDWTTTIGTEKYAIKIAANVSVGEEPESSNPNGSMNYIKVDGGTNRSYINPNRYTGEWRSEGRENFTISEDNPAAHETGHLLGLADQYRDVDDGNGGKRSVPNEGWFGNIMANGRTGSVQNINIFGVMYIIKNSSNNFSTKNGIIKSSEWRRNGIY